MKKLFFALLLLSSITAVAQPKHYVVPVAVTVGNEQQNSNQGIRAVGGTAYGGPEYNENRNVVRFQETLAPGETLSFDIINQNNMYVIGLAPGTSHTNVYSTPVGNTQVRYGMTVGNSSKASVYEGGYIITNTTIASGNYLQIAYEGTQIKYKKSTNGGSTWSTFYTSTWTASGSYNIYFEAPPQYAGPNNIYKQGTVTNQAPTVSAGPDKATTLPTNQVTLTGTATDPDGTIATRAWTKVSGPAGGDLATANNISTQVTNLQLGSYVYRFTATDNQGASAQDEATVTVSGADPNGSTTLTFPVIPFSQPDFKWRGGGSEQWHDQYYVNIPTEADRKPLDAVYFRFAWKEIETSQNVFRWATLEDEIKRCIDAGQVFGFGIMTQTASSSWRTGVQMDQDQGVTMYYPVYLHRMMQAGATNTRDYIRHDGGEWVPNYNHPEFIAQTRKLNDSIYAWLNRTSYKGHKYADVINYIDIRHVGEWGEWHYNHTAPDTTYWPAGRQPTIASYKAIIDAYVDAYPTLKTAINVSVYDARQIPNTWIPAEVAHYALTKRNAWGLVGWRRDQWGFADNQATYVRTWTDQNVKTFGGMRFDTVIMDRHNFAPVIGEPPGNWNNGDQPYMKNLPTETRRYKPMSWGNGNFWTSPMYRPDLLTQGTRDSVRLASKLAGARLQIDSAVMSTQTTQGGIINLKVYWRNAGVCPTYETWIVKYRIKDGSGTTVMTSTSNFKPKWFRVNPTPTLVEDQITVPGNLPTGSYSLWMIIEDSLAYRPPLAIANQGRTAAGEYQLRSSFQIGEECTDCVAMRSSRNKWRISFFILLGVALIVTLLGNTLRAKLKGR